MSYEKTLLLGAIAGFTIFLGLPLARLRNIGTRVRLAASMASAGVLAFLFFDVLAGSNEIVEGALAQAKDGEASWARFAGLLAMLVVGFGAGLIGLGVVEKRILGGPPPIAGGSDALVLGDSPLASLPRPHISSGMRMGMLIAVAIGVHNFSEGLAIGVSAHAGEVALATTLIVGFALHNATEGFGIVGPLDRRRTHGARHCPRLPGRLRSPAARLSGPCRRRDPLHHHRAVGNGAPPRSPGTRNECSGHRVPCCLRQ
jgi:zinc transporter, ZIP family